VPLDNVERSDIGNLNSRAGPREVHVCRVDVRRNTKYRATGKIWPARVTFQR